MKLLADEGLEHYIVKYLLKKGLDIKPNKDIKKRIEDEEVLAMSRYYERILITRDRDFGELVFITKNFTPELF